MTKRQQAVSVLVDKHRADLIVMAEQELRDHPIGFSVVVRLCIGVFEGCLSVIVMKTEPNQFRWRENNPRFYLRKGRTEPGWRPL